MINFIIQISVMLHVISMAGLVIFGCHRFWLLVSWRKKTNTPHVNPVSEKRTPVVTIQLPLYNESRVALRLIDAAAKIDWPKNCLDIQILDDSTDGTRRLAEDRAAQWKGCGQSMQVLHRSSRSGYKAGALSNGLRYAKGEFIAIFDADFIPPRDFLKKTIPHFSSPDVGMVQTRWKFLNAGYSWLTRLQELFLSSHFRIEQYVRFHRRLFFNFNGTAGVWRRAAIESAGGWQSDTVTEDLDISYRAQLAGWRFIYLDSMTVASELPITLKDFRSQQQRWSKGSIQTARKILPLIFKSRLPVQVKTETAAHLLANFCWLFGFVATLTLYPLIIYRTGIGPYQLLRIDVPVFIFSGGAFLFYYLCYAISSKRYRSLPLLLILPAFSIGLAAALSFSVLKGCFSNGGPFIRTPKFGIREKSKTESTIVFSKSGDTLRILFINAALLVYTFAPIILAVRRETWSAVPFLCLFPLGFFLMIKTDLHDRFQSNDIAGEATETALIIRRGSRNR